MEKQTGGYDKNHVVRCLGCSEGYLIPLHNWRENPFEFTCTKCSAVVVFELSELNPIKFETVYCLVDGNKKFPGLSR